MRICRLAALLTRNQSSIAHVSLAPQRCYSNNGRSGARNPPFQSSSSRYGDSSRTGEHRSADRDNRPLKSRQSSEWQNVHDDEAMHFETGGSWRRPSSSSFGVRQRGSLPRSDFFRKDALQFQSRRSDYGRRHDDDYVSPVKPIGEFLYGFHPVVEALRVGRRKAHKLHVLETHFSVQSAGGTQKIVASDKTPDSSQRRVIEQVSKLRSIEVVPTSRQHLNAMADNRPHNGVVLDVEPIEFSTIPHLDAELLTASPHAAASSAAEPAGRYSFPLWMILDEVVDPQNLGAILRSSQYFGVQGVVICARNSAPLSPVTSKASSGAMERLQILACNSMPRFLRSTKERYRTAGLSPPLNIIGMSLSESALDCKSIRFTASGPTLLVVGNEGHGLRSLVQAECSHLVRIHSHASAGTGSSLDSLNVSNAVAVALYQLT